jgi:hypothetical protein
MFCLILILYKALEIATTAHLAFAVGTYGFNNLTFQFILNLRGQFLVRVNKIYRFFHNFLRLGFKSSVVVHLLNSIGLLYLRSLSMSHFAIFIDTICAPRKTKGDNKTKLNARPELALDKNITIKTIRPAAKTKTAKTIDAIPKRIDIRAKPMYLCLLLIAVSVILLHY